ncbi:MAG: hypothetical protein UX30_C0014G0005 [Candidatus Saccharibacteria bacterium GW2011_GWA2_46_10]|nr:MAG: hypothetical protein UX30_C0014G0005 [Candidatus Saccharibacteria bacterium GW2011_GWA2_46_10]
MTKPLGDNQTDNFSTFDLGCSAALISVGFELLSLDKQNPRKVLFIFTRKVGIEEVANDYFLGKLKVSARTLFDNTKMLKNRIYSSF